MRRPNNYDEAKVQGEYTPVELGGHKMVIKSVEEMCIRDRSSVKACTH